MIRFSSFGDIVQASTANVALKKKFPESEINWLTKSAFLSLLEADPNVDRVVTLESFSGLVSIFKWIKKQRFELIYDAHSSLRSSLIYLLIVSFGKTAQWVTRPKYRWKRFLLFKFRINTFPKPFVGQASYLSPLKDHGIELSPNNTQWNFGKEIIQKVDNLTKKEEFVVFAPSAAWEMKRWPVAHWKKLIDLTTLNFPYLKIILVGGPSDDFIKELDYHKSVLNLSGKLSLIESSYLVTKASMTISADTGIIHVVDAHRGAGVLLNGPTAFGKTFSPTVKILEENLYCQPCSKDGRGKCERQIYQQCMVEISPERVFEEIKKELN